MAASRDTKITSSDFDKMYFKNIRLANLTSPVEPI
jgi:hypothetical protein